MNQYHLPVIDEEVEELTDLTDETNSRIVAAKTLLSVPFIVQAPFAKWELPYKEACEEASILMLHQYKLGVNELSEDQMIELIDDVIAWETDQYGDRIHSSSDDTLLYLTELYGHDEESVSVIRNFTIEDMKAILDSGYPILVPAAGRDLGNENFRDPGPLYHMLVVIGYNQTEFITNDPGTRNGARYRYDQQVLFDAIHDLTDNVEDITERRKSHDCFKIKYMIPYIGFTSFSLGPITIQVWGSMVAIAILIGVWLAVKFAEKNDLDKQFITDGATWIIISALIGARLFHVFIYEFAYYKENLLEIFAVWKGGGSEIGGILGAIIAYYIFVSIKKVNWRTYLDSFAFGLPLAFACGRIGCFLIHDHPGTLTDFALGVVYPTGHIRHDLGLYLLIGNLVMAIVFFFLWKKKWHTAFYVQIFMIWYGFLRFFLDFLRIIDIRYAGLTPAQYVSIVMIVGGIIWFISSYRNHQKNSTHISQSVSQPIS